MVINYIFVNKHIIPYGANKNWKRHGIFYDGIWQSTLKWIVYSYEIDSPKIHLSQYIYL
jgi:hypothetical protein